MILKTIKTITNLSETVESDCHFDIIYTVLQKKKLRYTIDEYDHFGPRVYPKGSLVIALVRVSVGGSVRVCVCL